MDGARLFNAAVYLKVPASRIVRDFTSATFCISKGLGAPVGAILAGDKEFVRKQVSVYLSLLVRRKNII
jgi:threonine aldolase